MRIFCLFIAAVFFFAVPFPSWANEDTIRQRILNHLRIATSPVEIQIPADVTAQSPYGPDPYPVPPTERVSGFQMEQQKAACQGAEFNFPESSDEQCSDPTRPRRWSRVYRRLVGKELYPRLVGAVVYIVTEDGTAGAGTVISSSFGLIVTNWHVVGNEKVVGLVFKPKGSNGAIFFDKDDIYFARVLTTDSIRDLALLEIVSPPGKMIAVPLGSTQNLAPGHQVFSVSHPRGSLWSYAEGTVRDITPQHEWVRGLGMVHRADTIQAHTSSNGSSGDPLFNKDGQFIGVLVGESISEPNFAISIDEVREFVFSSLR